MLGPARHRPNYCCALSRLRTVLMLACTSSSCVEGGDHVDVPARCLWPVKADLVHIERAGDEHLVAIPRSTMHGCGLRTYLGVSCALSGSQPHEPCGSTVRCGPVSFVGSGSDAARDGSDKFLCTLDSSNFRAHWTLSEIKRLG